MRNLHLDEVMIDFFISQMINEIKQMFPLKKNGFHSLPLSGNSFYEIKKMGN